MQVKFTLIGAAAIALDRQATHRSRVFPYERSFANHRPHWSVALTGPFPSVRAATRQAIRQLFP